MSFSPTRNHSTIDPPRAYMASTPPHQARGRNGSLIDIGYNGSEGHIDDHRPSIDFDHYRSNEIQLTTPPKAVSPTRQALGARFLSSLTNAQPTAAALSRKGSVLHSRAMSLAAYVPSLSNSNTTTPEKVQTPNRIFGDLFKGESAPIRIGPPISPIKELEESEFIMEYRSCLTERPAHLRRRSTAITQASSTTTNKTSWFGRKQSTTPGTISQQAQDDLTSLNINASLFPTGSADPLNPSSFNDLLLNATALLNRMQNAYKEKVSYIASIQPEIDAQKEEVEEAETRATHLKMQLEEMSRQAQERELAMQELSRQLTDEKMKVLEMKETAAKSIRLVRPPTADADGEDDITPRRRKRGSAASVSDSGFESDMESVFSAASSAETPLSPVISIVHMSDHYERPGWNVRHREPLQRRLSTSTTSTNPGISAPIQNLKGRMGRDGAAWATVETLRAENSELRTQMEATQANLQGCIDLISGLGLSV